MSLPERGEPPQEVVGALMDRFSHIVGRGRTPFVEQAHWVFTMVAGRRFPLALLGPQEESETVWATDFRFATDTTTRGGSGTICIAPQRFHSLEPDVLDSDIIRTVSIAVQFPNCFDRRIREVYASALDDQQAWMVKSPYDGYPLDPRVEPYDEIIRKLLGDKAYFSDFGYFDWQRALELLRADVDGVDVQVAGAELQERIDALQTSKRDFMWARSHSMFDEGPNLPLTPDQRKRLREMGNEELSLQNARHAATEAIKYQI